MSETLALVPVAASCFVVIIAQSAATARVFALRYRERVDEDADILGLSAANAAAAVSGAFVVNGSPTQTAMADRAGARSQLAQLVFAGVVLLVLLALTGPLQYLPRCVLAAIVFTIAVGMIDMPRPARHPPRKLGRIHPCRRHRRRGRDHRRRGRHRAGDRVLAVPACAPQLSPAHGGACVRCGRPAHPGAGDARHGDRAGSRRLSLRRRSVLRQRSSLHRRCARPRGARADAGALVHRRRGGDHRSRLFRRALDPGTARRSGAQRRSA